MSLTLNITQLELQKKREELKTAISARDLLEERVTSLIEELTKRGKELIELKIKVLNLISQAQKILALVQGSDGSKVDFGAVNSKERFFISYKDISQNGIRGTALNLEGKLSTLKDREMTLFDTSYKIDCVIKIHEQMIAKIVKLASEEIFLREIGDELKKTQKRVNALDNILIKDIKQAIYVINESLEDQDREEIAKIQVFLKKRKK